MSRAKLASKPRKAAKDRKAMYRCESGPFSGHDFALSDGCTMVFAVEAVGQRWRGRYVSGGKGRLEWQAVPLQMIAA